MILTAIVGFLFVVVLSSSTTTFSSPPAPLFLGDFAFAIVVNGANAFASSSSTTFITPPPRASLPFKVVSSFFFFNFFSLSRSSFCFFRFTLFFSKSSSSSGSSNASHGYRRRCRASSKSTPPKHISFTDFCIAFKYIKQYPNFVSRSPPARIAFSLNTYPSLAFLALCFNSFKVTFERDFVLVFFDAL